MAEEIVNLFEIQIDTTAALKDLASSQRKVKALKDEIKDLQKAEGDNTEELAGLTAALKAEQKELRTNTSLAQNSLQARNQENGSIEEMRSQLAIVSIEWARMSEEQRKNTEEGKALTAQKLALTDALKEEEGATGDTRRNVGNYSEGILEASEAMGTFVPGADAAGGAVKQLGIAINLGLGPIGLIIAAVALIAAAFKAFFTSTQEGQDSMKKLTAVFEAATMIITNLLVGLAEALMKPQETLDQMRAFFQDTLGNIITGIFENAMARIGKTIAILGVAWENLKDIFTDNAEGIVEANATVERANQAIADSQAKIDKGIANSVDAYEDLTEAVTDLVDEGMRQAEIMGVIAKSQIALDEANIRATTSLAKLNAEAELASAIASDSTESFKTQQEAAEKARVASEEAIRLSITLAKQELGILQARNAQLANNGQLVRENRQEEADMIAAVIALDSQLILKKRENAQQRQEIDRDVFEKNLDFLLDNFDSVKTLNELAAADDKKTFEARAGIIDATKKLANQSFEEQIKQLQTRTEAEISASDLLAESDSKRLIERVRLLELDEIEETRLLEVIRERRTVLQDLKDAEAEINEERLAANQEARMLDAENARVLAETNIISQLDQERVGLEAKRAQEIEFAEKIGADTSLINQKFRAASKALDAAEFSAKLSLAEGFANSVAQIAGENTAVGKAAAVAAATMNTYQAATGAFASLAPIPVVGPALGAAAAGAAVVAGIANVKKILSTKSGLPGESSGSGSSVSVATPAATSTRATAVEDVNTGILSRDSANIGGGETTTVQPTLVVDEVTSSQNTEASNLKTGTV